MISRENLMYGTAAILATIYYVFRYANILALGSIRIFMWLAFACLLLKLLFDKYDFKTLMIFAITLVGTYLACAKVGEMALLISVGFILAAKNICLEQMYKVFLGTINVCNVLIITVFIVENGLKTVSFRGTRARYALGYVHPNRFAMIIYIIMELYILLHYADHPKKTIIVSGVLAVTAYFLTNSRTPALLSSMVILLLILSSRYDIKRIMKPILLICFPICLFCSYYGSLHCSQVPWRYLNRWMTHRLSYGAMALKYNSVSLLPQNLYKIEVLDNGYLNLLLKFGWIITAIYWLAYIVLWKKYYDRLSTETVILIVIGAFYFMSEDIALTLCYNPMLLVFSNCILGDAVYEADHGIHKSVMRIKRVE